MPINSTTNSEGKYNVAVKYFEEVQRLMANYGVTRNVFKPIYVNLPSGFLADIIAIPTVYSPSQGDAPTASMPTWGQSSYSLKALAALVEANTDWLEDAFGTPEDTLISTMSEALARAEDVDCLLGDGTSTYHGITGLLNMANTQEIDMAMGDLTYDDVLEGEALIAEAKGMNTAIIASPRGLKSLKLMKDGSGRYIFTDFGTRTNDVSKPVNMVGLLNASTQVYLSHALVEYEAANSKGVMFMVDGNKAAKFILRYNEIKFKKEEVQKQWRFAYSMYERLDFTPIFPQLVVKFTNMSL